MNHSYKRSLLLMLMAVVVALPLFGNGSANADGLDLSQAISIAQTKDPWLEGNRHSQDATEAQSISAGTLPDPRISLLANNLPTDTFDLGQEPMTQLSLGVTQIFPRGDSRELMKRQLQQIGHQHPFLRQDRRARVAVTVSHLWLEAYKAQQSVALIENDRELFEQLLDVSEASYSSALGKSRQQDVIRAQLEITRLEDRLTTLTQAQETFKQRLGEWIGPAAGTGQLSRRLPELALIRPLARNQFPPSSQQMTTDILMRHPAVMALDKKIESTETGVELARQKYKPEWGVTARYGYRDKDPMGNDRADFFSVGVSFDLPLFTGNRQDKDVSAAISRTEAIKTDKWLLLRQMLSAIETNRAQLKRLDERHRLYRTQLLTQMREQAEASLSAYTRDDGDFAEVVRARIAELNARIEALGISVERQKTIAQLNYFLAGATEPLADEKPQDQGE